jgi:signal transduction histidine kinase/DNA-binding response OmpR family regulator
MRKIVLLFLLCCSLASSGQNKELDSLYSIINNETLPNDTTKVNTLLLVAGEVRGFDLEKSKAVAEKALALSQSLNYMKGEGGVNFFMGGYYLEAGDYEKAGSLGLKALAIYEKMDYKTGIARCYSMLGRLQTDLKSPEKSLYYWRKSVDLNKFLNNKSDLGYAYNGIGNVFLEIDGLDSSLYYHQLALKVREEIGTEKGISQSYRSMAAVLIEQKKYDQSIEYNLKSLAIQKKIGGTPTQLALITGNIGRAYLFKKDYNNARRYLSESLVLAKKTGAIRFLVNLYVNLSLLEEKSGNAGKALEYERLRSHFKDSLFDEQKNENLAEAEARFETEKKEKEIQLLEQTTKTQTLWRNSLVAGLLFTLVAATTIYLLQRSRTRKAKLLLETQELLNVQMREAEKLKSRFFANISHEFRTPLTLILNPVEEKLLAENLSQKDKASFQTIRRSANRLLELINQILELSKLESGFMKINKQPGNLYHFIMPVLSSFDSMADVSQAQYRKEVSIPETPVLFDSDKLEKILNNLLSNAFKFSPKAGRVDIKALATEKEKSLALLIEIKNSGSIIPPDSLVKIFDPFFQDSTTSALGMPGTGLGLSLVKELVKLQEGDIRVTSTAEEGTVFTVTLLLEKSDREGLISRNEKAEVTPYMPESSEMVPLETGPAKETLLIVEDNKDVRTLIRNGLEGYYNIVEASTGKEGLEVAREQPADLIVSDVMMPVMNGIELCHLLKNDERTSHIPIILLTARADHESKLEGLRTGADDYVVKPFNMQELLARIANLIGQRKKLIEKYKQRVMIQPHEITVTPLDERFILKAIQIIEANLDSTTLSVEKMSEELGMSRTNVHRKLKAITGLATSEFIQDFRLRRAAQLIEKKADTISQIAYQVGFNDQSYFTKCFKKKFGKVPSEFHHEPELN